MVSTAAFHARVRGSVPGLGGFKETKMFLPHPRVKVSIVGSLRDRKVAGPVQPICAQRWPKARLISFFDQVIMARWSVLHGDVTYNVGSMLAHVGGPTLIRVSRSAQLNDS